MPFSLQRVRVRPLTLIFAASLSGAMIALAGCSSTPPINKAAVVAHIDHELAQPSACIALQPYATLPVATGKSYPVSVAISQWSASAGEWGMNRAPFAALADAGLLTASHGTMQDPQFAVRHRVPSRVYALTGMGRAALQQPNGTAFCAGHYRLVKLTQFTKPGQASTGATIAFARFTYDVTGVPAWASSSAIRKEYPAAAKAIAQGQHARPDGLATLTLAKSPRRWLVKVDDP